MRLPQTLRVSVAAIGLVSIGAILGAAYGESKATAHIPRGKPGDFSWVDLPEFGGREAIIYRSPDGTRVAAAFEERGAATFTYPFDEFLVVTSGSVEISVHGGERFELSTGEVAYIREGTTVDFRFSDDFSDVTCLMSDREVKWR
jgi:uncharacterized cupin superfamily protein